MTITEQSIRDAHQAGRHDAARILLGQLLKESCFEADTFEEACAAVRAIFESVRPPMRAVMPTPELDRVNGTNSNRDRERVKDMLLTDWKTIRQLSEATGMNTGTCWEHVQRLRIGHGGRIEERIGERNGSGRKPREYKFIEG